ncbi:glutathione S-transferase-like [Tripterygium wilfordii]|uniref:glutathione transferase n=1 Tax=Tripterygium wilfordii TaxID=458696 RepID=A0A7J7CBG4_TRIWF|nr:glutathione S-transferase PARB-like [Tripterygium wilfordii]KAF5731459.1 glutathione S-transferase-like [Tripterygium wilfordii]
MADMKIHGSMISTATFRVLACLYEKEVHDFQFVNVDMAKGEHKKEPYLSLNPFGQLPAFEQGDLKLFESRAITKHLAHVYATKGNPLSCHGELLPMLMQWMEVEEQQFESPSSKLVFELCIKPMLGMPIDEAAVEGNTAKLAKVLDVYESRLGQSKYMACDWFTLVDMHHLPNIEYLMATKVKTLFDSRPRVSAWVKDIRARPAWAKVLAMKTNQA